MSPVKRPGAVPAGLRHATAVPATEVHEESRVVPRIITDESIGRPENIGILLPPSQRPKPPKPTRFTLDLDADRHRFLKNYATEIEAKGASEVMRALLDELRDDPELAARVRARVWQGR